MIVVGDLHLKETEPYWSAQKEFLNFLTDNFNDEIIVFLGDVFDSSSPQWEIYSVFKKYLLNKKSHTYIVQGNHDFSKRKGSALEGLHLMNNVSIFFEEQDFSIVSLKCLALPYKFGDLREYENIKGDYDVVFSHVTPNECAFADEGLNLEKSIKSKYFVYGHTHTQKEWNSKDSTHIVVGVPLPTRNLEEPGCIYRIDSQDCILQKIEIPIFFKIKNINYGDEIENKNWLYNIKNAPSYESVYEKYKGFYIRNEGIEIEKNAFDFESNENFVFETSNIREKFLEYAKEKNLRKEVVDTSVSYLERL